MSARRLTALLAAVLITATISPAVAFAGPAGNGPGPRASVSDQPTAATPAPTVVHTTVVKEEAARTLPIALAGAALLISLAGTGYALVRVAPLRHQLRGEH
jgi:hypothetical protein